MGLNSCVFKWRRIDSKDFFWDFFNKKWSWWNGNWWVNSLPSAACMCRWTGSTLVQIMVCRLVGAKPLSEPMLGYCWLDPEEETSVRFQSKCVPLIKIIAIEDVVRLTAAILSRGRWVNISRPEQGRILQTTLLEDLLLGTNLEQTPCWPNEPCYLGQYLYDAETGIFLYN